MKWCTTVCSAPVLVGAGGMAVNFLFETTQDGCPADPGEAVTHGRAWTEAAIGGAPIWARNTVLAALATKAARKASEFEGQSCCGLAQALLKTDPQPPARRAPPAGARSSGARRLLAGPERRSRRRGRMRADPCD